MKLGLVTIFAVLVAGLSGCGTRTSSESAKKQAPDLAAFTKEYFASYFTFNPSEGTAAGLHEYDEKIEDRTRRTIQARIAELKLQLTRITELRKAPLSSQHAIDAELIENNIRAQLLDLDTIRVWRSPLFYAGIAGNAVDLLMKRNFDTPAARLQKVTVRLKGIPALIDAMRDNTFEPPREFTDLAIRIMKGSVPYFRKDVADWARTAAGDNETLLTEFNSANAQAAAALQVMADHLETNVTVGSTGNYAIGAENFANKLRFEEMVDIPLDRLLAIGETRLKQDHDAFVQVARIVAPGRSPQDAMAVLERQHPTESGLMDFARSTLESARSFVLAKNIIPIPSELLPKVEPTPPYARSGTFASMDTPGPFEAKAREAFYYVTPPEAEWDAAHKEEHLKLYNQPVMNMITIHEAYPGHYVQFLYAKEFPTTVRKLIFASSNAEGWAHYCEQMMLEEGFGGGDPKIRLAQLSEALVRDARYVSGIRLHTSGWTVAQATKLFEDQAFMQHANAFEEARRGTYNPTYLYYTLGKLEIYKLREDYKRAKGSEYSLGKFHEQFVKQGSIPIRVIRHILLPGDTQPDL